MGAHVRSFFMEPNQYNKKWIKKFCQVERGCTVLTAIETSINDLIPYENNPRNNDGAVEAVAASIREFGFKVPIIADKNNVIVAGHTRLKAAKLLGLKKVPVIKADDLTDEQVRAFRLADNKTAEIAEWDFEKLDKKLEGIVDIDMSQFGFEKLEPVDVSEFTEESEPKEKDETPEFVTCPHCGETFNAKTAEGWK